MSTNPLLDNIFWHALTGPQAHLAAGSGGARRFARGFSPIAAFADPAYPDLHALAPCCEVGEPVYFSDWAGPVPPGWKVEAEATMYRMVWAGPMPGQDEAPDAVPLGSGHAVQAMELAALTRPGPFGPRTIELGEYFGYFENGQLIAMTGERAFAPGLREVSGVCTHPDHQGKGLARKLMSKVVRRQMQRGETPFLHVMSANTSAHNLYLRMGFVDYLEPVVRVMSKV
jgi:ribosomal protein S18 acetylase RimI-like enzyme